MSRLIKFRAWHKREKVMMLFDLGELNDSMITKVDDGWYLEDCEIMQFTGLKDKQGKEIYEGDIVKGDNEWVDFGQPVSVVKYEHGTWNYAYVLVEYSEQPEKSWEVIGNVYEHPELLTDR